MKFFLDECMNAKVDDPLKAWLKNDDFLRSGPSIPRGLGDIELIKLLEKHGVEVVITSDIKQMRSPDRAGERAQYKDSGIHWVGVPQSFVKGRARPFVQAANLLSVIHYVKSQLDAAKMPLAIELKRGFKVSDDPISDTFPI